jgi:hypothetical protein
VARRELFGNCDSNEAIKEGGGKVSNASKIFEKEKSVVSNLILSNLKKAVDAPNALDKAHYATQAFFLLNEDQQKFLGKDLAETLYYCSSAIRSAKTWKYNFVQKPKKKEEKREEDNGMLFRELKDLFVDLDLPILSPAPLIATMIYTFYRIDWPFETTRENYEKYIKPWFNGKIPESVTAQGTEHYQLFFSATKGLTKNGFYDLKNAFLNYAFVASLALVNKIASLLGEELLPFLNQEGEEKNES